MLLLEIKCPQLSKPEATAARNQSSICDRNGEKTWEKPGSVRGASSPFVYKPGIGVDDTVILLLQRSLSHLEVAGNMSESCFDSSSAFNTIQPSLLKFKMERAGVHANLVIWITNYLTYRLQYVRLQNCV